MLFPILGAEAGEKAPVSSPLRMAENGMDYEEKANNYTKLSDSSECIHNKNLYICSSC